MRNFYLLLTLIYVFSPVLFHAQQINPSKWCSVMEGLEQRIQNDAEYAAFREAATNMPKGVAKSIPCDGTNSVVIPLAFHFDASFSCADPSCLLTKVEEQIDALNVAFGDNSTLQQNIDLNAICPAGYPIGDVSTGTCIEFKLAAPPAGQGLDPACDPAITIGQYGGGIQTDFNGAGAAWAGYLNIFVVEEVQVSIFGITIPGIIGVADGIPGMANGDGVTLLADAFGGIGAGCNSGNDLDVGATDGTSFFFTEGGTTAHEIGHYLGCYHIWGDDQPIFGGTPPFCTGDDSNPPQPIVGPFVVNDTPLQSEASPTNAPCPTIAGATCTSFPATCGSNDYFHNYMDYSNDICMSMFTVDQSIVMNYWANQLFGGSTIPTFNSVPTTLTTLCDMQPCAACAPLDLTFNFDATAQQTSWQILDANGALLSAGGAYNQGDNSAIESVCLPDGCYDLVVSDSANNGMCPFRSTASSTGLFVTPGTVIAPGSIVATLGTVVSPGLCGNYTLTDANGNTITTGGGGFGTSETNSFCIVGGVPQLNAAPNYARQTSDLNENFGLFRLYPNPTRDILHIQFDQNTDTEIQLNIVDITGKVIYTEARHIFDSTIQLNVNDLNSGVYLIQIVDEGSVSTKKFVVE